MIAFERGARVEIEAELEPAIAAIPLPGITVHAERRPRHLVQEGFYSRREQGLGSFLEREESRPTRRGGRPVPGVRPAAGVHRLVALRAVRRDVPARRRCFFCGTIVIWTRF
jgi:hypothetical protein